MRGGNPQFDGIRTSLHGNDIRRQVTRRKISGGTRSDVRRDCRDGFLGLSKTCAKPGIGFWDHLGATLAIRESAAIPYLRTRRGSVPPALTARAFAPLTRETRYSGYSRISVGAMRCQRCSKMRFQLSQ
jgi:hypothetical protein